MPSSLPLFVSPIQPIGGCSPNVYAWDKRPPPLRVSMTFLDHPGLAFLGANLPCRTLPYPTAKAFARALEHPPEILGISFFINETEVALQMAAQARRAGVREIWAGGFGAYTPEIRGAFDRAFTGWGESAVAEALGHAPIPLEQLRHPEIYGAFGTNLFPRMVLSGILHTSRGCPWTCTFCQTPEFYGRPIALPLETIDRTLWTYHRRGLTGVNILDENFGTFPRHAGEVVRMLDRYGMRWIALTRVDTLLRHFDDWTAKGLFGAHLGIESLNQASLEGASKRITDGESLRLLREMGRRNMFVQGFYIIGFEEDTPASVRRDLDLLATLDVDVVQVQVLTPYPETLQRRQIAATYGLIDTNLSRYNSRHLVWRHPNISVTEMRALQEWGHRRLATSRRAARTLSKFAIFFGRPRPNWAGVWHVAASFRQPLQALHAELGPRLAGARRSAKVGWPAYEEVPSSIAVTAGRPRGTTVAAS